MRAPDSATSAPVIQVIQLENERDREEVLKAARELFAKDGVQIETRSEFVPAVVGDLAGFVASIQPVVGPIASTIATAVAGAATKEFIAWLKKRGKSPRVNATAAEAIAVADLDKLGVKEHNRIRSKILPGCDKALTTPKPCFSFVFEDVNTHKHFAYVLTNEGEIASFQSQG